MTDHGLDGIVVLFVVAVFVVFAATDALLNLWLRRQHEPFARRDGAAWSAWWCLLGGAAGLADVHLYGAFRFLIGAAFAGPMLLAALCGHKAWADDAYVFVDSWGQVKAAWSSAGTATTVAVVDPMAVAEPMAAAAAEHGSGSGGSGTRRALR